MDWLKDFEMRFGTDDDLRKLGAKKLHGSIQINFCNGHPVNYNLTIHKRSAYSVAMGPMNQETTTAPSLSQTTYTNSTLTQGESDGTSGIRK
jgi:hypothetical protein